MENKRILKQIDLILSRRIILGMILGAILGAVGGGSNNGCGDFYVSLGSCWKLA